MKDCYISQNIHTNIKVTVRYLNKKFYIKPKTSYSYVENQNLVQVVLYHKY